MNGLRLMNKKTTLQELISTTSLNRLAGDKAFQLGKEYFDDGAVRKLSSTIDTVRAQVQGSASYRVVLRTDMGKLTSECSCPRAGDGYFCKHCVAVGLAWLASMDELPVQTTSSARKRRADPWDDIQNYLRKQESDILIALVLDTARRDERLYRSLLLKAQRSASGADLAEILRKAIDNATHTNGFIAWDEVRDVLDTLNDIVDSLAELLQPSTSHMLVELLEYAIKRIENMLEEVDDSDGGMGGIVAHLGELHVEACRMSMPDPVALAERLFKLETTLPFGICSFAPSLYRDVLGEAGLQQYRKLATSKWHTVEALKVGDPYQPGRIAITRIMENLAKESGSIEELVDIKSRDLSSCFRYLNIAELWYKAGKMTPALEWAERGLAAFPDRTDNRLRDFLVEIYLKCGREDEALQLTRIQLEEYPSLENYKKLALVAGKVDQWPAQREPALLVVDTAIAARNTTHRLWGHPTTKPNYSLRVAIALWEQNISAAWQYANLGTCDQNLLIALAGKLEMARLDDAIELYRRVVSALIEQTNNDAYKEAVNLVQKMAGALSAHQRRQELTTYIEYLRVEFKRKRNFIKLLDHFALT